MIIACDKPDEHLLVALELSRDSDEIDAWCLRCQAERAEQS